MRLAAVVFALTLFLGSSLCWAESVEPPTEATAQESPTPNVAPLQLLTFPIHILGVVGSAAIGAKMSEGGPAAYVVPSLLIVSPLVGGFATWGVGELSGGSARFWATWLGAVVGTGLGLGASLGLAVAIDPDSGDVGFTVMAVGITSILSTSGAMLGYGLTRDEQAERVEAGMSSVQPFLAPTDGGATIGLGGRF